MKENNKAGSKIEEIQALLKIVQNMPEKNIQIHRGVITQLKTRKGKVFVDIYDNEEESSCAKFFCMAGTEMDWHVHKVIQVMICIKGQAEFFLNGDKQEIVTLRPGDVIRFLPRDKHFAVMDEYTEFYDIKIPRE